MVFWIKASHGQKESIFLEKSQTENDHLQKTNLENFASTPAHF